MIDIVFLTYVQRSGSTYFASLLNNCKELGVSLSSGSLGKIIDAKQLPIRTEADAAVICEELFEDSKFREWQISKEYLMDVLKKLPFPIYFPDLLELVLVTYFQRVKPSAKLFIFKRGNYIYRWQSLVRMFPHAKFIYLYRDPRGVFNSQKHSRRSRSDQPFETNPISFSKRWIRSIQAARVLESNSRFISVRYENLINHTEEVMDYVCKFIGVKNGLDKNIKSYYSMIPEVEKHLHKLVKEPPRKDRINAWQNSLSNADIWIIDRYTAKYLERSGYRRLNIKADRFIHVEHGRYLKRYYGGVMKNIMHNRMASTWSRSSKRKSSLIPT